MTDPFIQNEPNTHGPSAIRIRLKVVPGSRREQIVGPLGDRLKVKVAAPPEDGKANHAVCALLAATLNIDQRRVSIIAGQTNPEKIARIEGMSAEMLEPNWWSR